MAKQTDQQPPTVRAVETSPMDRSPSRPTTNSSNAEPPNGGFRFSMFYSFLGFSKGYNASLFIVLGGALLVFCLARISLLDIGDTLSKKLAPGEWYWYRQGHYRVGIALHLSCVIPAGILGVLQFVPAIRHRAILFHRINGRVAIILILLGNVGGLMIARRSFGGYLSTQAGIGALAIMTTVGLSLAYHNIKGLQIDQHRAWMLRSWVYLGAIITTRLVMIISAIVISQAGDYYSPMTCGEIHHLVGRARTTDKYPICANTNTTTSSSDNRVVPVNARFGGRLEEVAASMRVPFGMSLWTALLLHAVGVELYLALTPREAQRLREISHHRQLEAGRATLVRRARPHRKVWGRG